jgi:hypothetical protein
MILNIVNTSRYSINTLPRFVEVKTIVVSNHFFAHKSGLRVPLEEASALLKGENSTLKKKLN